MADHTTKEETSQPKPSERQAVEQPRDILQVRGLRKVYPDGTLAVDDIDFDVKDGDFCVLIGPSGCGKSTTLHSIIGKVTPTKGEILLDDVDITGTPTYERDIGLVFQDFQLFPHLTVENNVRYGLDRVGVEASTKTERVEEMLQLMQLQDVRDRSPEELSAGQKQRVALARSLVLKPKLLLLDEPLGDLDYKMQKRMERELLRIHRELETTFVYVTHDQNQAMRLGDQIVVMNEGQIEQSGTVSEVYNQPATAFVASFVGDSNIFTGQIVDAQDTAATVTVSTAVGEFAVSTANTGVEGDSLVGEQVSFVVRPQHLRLDADSPNSLLCRVLDVISRPGRGTQLLLEAASGEETMEIQLKSESRLDIETETVTVGWDVEDTILLERTSVVSGVDLETDVLGE
ncbi:ABC transporter ATP-binding protein [Halorussus salinisoli]|uniref:ABC transporter ATP-binding protein n=1 Tax=Halorussus salinisoli TaxID=2558242 RepID=UPI0010C20BC5|nr:ABC transporter ATP-binding protein [Halorussus salinisoli]